MWAIENIKTVEGGRYTQGAGEFKPNTYSTFEITNLDYPILETIKPEIWSLYAQGNVNLLDHPYILACVGTRQPTQGAMRLYERSMLRAMERGFIFISGFAKGSDIAATQFALKQKQPTIVCMPSGFKFTYPKVHELYVQAVLDAGGLLLSEYPPDVSIYGDGPNDFKKQFLLNRNRVIVATSCAVLVCESSEISGTKNCINHALKNKRPIGLMGPYKDYTPPQYHHKVAQNHDCVLINSKDTLDDFFTRAEATSKVLQYAKYCLGAI